MKIPTDTLSTRDIFLSTIFKVLNLPLIGVEDAGGKRCIFTFANSEKAKELTTQYFNGELRLDPRRVFEEWKNLKSLAYSTTNFLK